MSCCRFYEVCRTPLLDVTQPLRNAATFASLAEQRRIVAKVDDLMALCERLEASLTATADTRCRPLLDALLDALLEALAPSPKREMEAAE